MTKAKIGFLITVLAITMIGVVAYFAYKKDANLEEKLVSTPVQEIILRDLGKNYPPTPKEVVKFYSEISKCYYNEDYTDEELEKMARQMRLLFDDELLQSNPEEQYISNLKADIKNFEENSYKISSFSPSSSTDVEYFTKDGRECAKLFCMYTIRKANDFSTSKEVFVLRKDEQTEHWKIFGFTVVTE